MCSSNERCSFTDGFAEAAILYFLSLVHSVRYPIGSVCRAGYKMSFSYPVLLDHEKQLHILPIISIRLRSPVLIHPDSLDLFTTLFPLLKLDTIHSH